MLRHAKTPDGNAVTGFTNTEEQAVGLTEVVPFLVEAGSAVARIPRLHVVTDGLQITGQNPASPGPAAEALLAKFRVRSPSRSSS